MRIFLVVQALQYLWGLGQCCLRANRNAGFFGIGLFKGCEVMGFMMNLLHFLT